MVFLLSVSGKECHFLPLKSEKVRGLFSWKRLQTLNVVGESTDRLLLSISISNRQVMVTIPAFTEEPNEH